MKKIMFSDRFHLTQAVLEGRKTQTRRLLHCPKTFGGKYVSGFRLCTNKQGVQFTYLVDEDECEIDGSVNVLSAYKIGEEVAIAQKYSDIENMPFDREFEIERGGKISAGWNNKMFVEATYMPHHIKITNVRVERLQDISEEDCIAEGIEFYGSYYGYRIPGATEIGWRTAQVAYSVLIDNVGKRGTWESNPFVFVYEFELID